jgi:hypothetical protein
MLTMVEYFHPAGSCCFLDELGALGIIFLSYLFIIGEGSMLGRVAVELKSCTVKRNGSLLPSDIFDDYAFLFSFEISLSFPGNGIRINILISPDALRFDNVEKVSGGRDWRDHCGRQDEFETMRGLESRLLSN